MTEQEQGRELAEALKAEARAELADVIAAFRDTEEGLL